MRSQDPGLAHEALAEPDGPNRVSLPSMLPPGFTLLATCETAEISGSSPEAEAVTASTGTDAFGDRLLKRLRTLLREGAAAADANRL
jgi:hypothetical protein